MLEFATWVESTPISKALFGISWLWPACESLHFIGLCMLIGRFLPLVFVLGLAGSLGRQRLIPESSGTLRTYQPLFVGMLIGVTLVLVALTFLPALALGPLAEGVH